MTLVGDLALWCMTRSAIVVEWAGFYQAAMYWRYTLQPRAFDSPAYAPMREFSYDLQGWIAAHLPLLAGTLGQYNAAGPWRTILGLIMLGKMLAVAFALWGVFEKRRLGDIDTDIGGDWTYWQFLWSRRLRSLTLPLLMCWWLFLAFMLWRGAPESSGWGTYSGLAVSAFLASLLNSYQYGAARLWRRGGPGR